MAKILSHTATVRRESDETGIAELSVQIPGIFGGMSLVENPVADGRYLRKTQVWTEDGSHGDRIENLRIEDRDGVLGSASASFPDYPVLQYLSDQQMGDPATGGLSIPIGNIIVIEPIDPIENRGLQFIPSQLYLCSRFVTGDGASGKHVCANYIWGKYFENA